MKIFFIITSLISLGGTERVAITLANALAEKHDIYLISKTLGKTSYPLSSKVEDVRYTYNTLSFRKHIQNLIDDIEPDLVVIHTMSKLTPFLLLTGLKAEQIWSYEHISFEFHSKFYQVIRKFIYKRLDKVLVLTQSQKNIFDKLSDNVVVIKNPSPLPITTQYYNTQSRNIISVGRLTYQKGYDILLQAWAEIFQNNPEWSLNIYGEGEDKAKLLNQAKKLGLPEDIFKGSASNIMEVYDSSSFYVMSSRFEGLPMVLIEAQSRGLPIISFDCPSGPNEIISHGKNGYLIPKNSYKQLAIFMQNLIDNQVLRNLMHNYSIVNAQHFKIETIMREWELLLNESTYDN